MLVGELDSHMVSCGSGPALAVCFHTFFSLFLTGQVEAGVGVGHGTLGHAHMPAVSFFILFFFERFLLQGTSACQKDRERQKDRK